MTLCFEIIFIWLQEEYQSCFSIIQTFMTSGKKKMEMAGHGYENVRLSTDGGLFSLEADV